MLVSIAFCAIFTAIYIGSVYNVKICGEENTHSSWAGLRDGNFWILLVATFAHASETHLVNNAAVLISASQLTESVLGPYRFAVFFVLCGTLGWIFSMVSNYLRYRNMGWEWVSSCGSSPATYAMLFFNVAVDENTHLSLKLTWICVGVFIAAEVWSLVLRATEKIKYNMNKGILLGVLVLLVSLCLTIEHPITSVGLLYIYLIKSTVFRLLNVCVFDTGSLSYPSSDHAAHFVGSLCGAVYGIVLSTNSGDISNKLLVVSSPLIYLFLRLVTNF